MGNRRKFTEEFKREAVAMAEQPGVTKTQVGQELGIRPNLLSRWSRELRENGPKAFGGAGHPRDEELASPRVAQRNVDPTGRLRAEPLFVNPRNGRRWTHYALRDAWNRACDAAGVGRVRLYEGTKHTMATDAIRRGVGERELQVFLGHTDVRSTRRYAQLPEHAMISVLRQRRDSVAG